ncbi:fatty acid desaturase [Roseovarius sp. D22-M7]|uniref:fatty acid desaturase n=1 Tax=Roseovarius sp. D22-M7 TaxID=3127116 RepID=UPI00300F8B22
MSTPLADLPRETRAALNIRATAPGLLHLAGHLGAIMATGTLIVLQPPLWWLALPVYGVLIVFLFTLQHECTHRTPFASDRLCDLVGHVIGLVVLNPFLWFRPFHFAHHRHTNRPGDPELDGPLLETRAQWLWHVSGIPYWRAQLALLIRLACGRETPAWLPAAMRSRAEREVRILLAIYALALLTLMWSPLVLWLWIVPCLLGQPALRLYLLAEHGDCPQVADMLENTRTTFTTRAVRALAWNMPYHAEHHLAPQVPFHRLPALHALIRDRLRVTAPGYAAFTRDYLARRR